MHQAPAAPPAISPPWVGFPIFRVSCLPPTLSQGVMARSSHRVDVPIAPIVEEPRTWTL